MESGSVTSAPFPINPLRKLHRIDWNSTLWKCWSWDQMFLCKVCTFSPELEFISKSTLKGQQSTSTSQNQHTSTSESTEESEPHPTTTTTVNTINTCIQTAHYWHLTPNCLCTETQHNANVFFLNEATESELINKCFFSWLVIHLSECDLRFTQSTVKCIVLTGTYHSSWKVFGMSLFRSGVLLQLPGGKSKIKTNAYLK